MKLKPFNAALFLTVALPAFAVVGSLWLVVTAFRLGDGALPGEYHWEGQQLDRDFSRSERAASLGVQARLWLPDASGTCRLTLHVAGAAPRALELKLVHGTRPELDRDVRLLPESGSAGYEGACGQVPAGHWHVELMDKGDGWSLQEDVSGTLDGATLAAAASPPKL